jgi:hypothetical protein
MEVGGQHHALAALPTGKTQYPLYRRLGGPQGWMGQVPKILHIWQVRYPGTEIAFYEKQIGHKKYSLINTIYLGI